jgi:CPA2 family monovalent cation:H+ antiporter-2/glutathione-regulated potassium-efflux system ancillary protein KefC
MLMATGTLFKMPGSERWLFGIALAQGGEFAFVLFQYSKVNGILPNDVVEPLISAVAISMFLTPLLFLLHARLAAGHDGDRQERAADTIKHQGNKVILAGFGRLGTDLGRFLIAAGIRPVILDHDAANVDILRRFGFEVYYGDITRLDLLEAAGAAEAELIIITIGDIEKARELIHLVQKHYPHLKIAANASDRSSAYELMNMGITIIRRETFGSALSLGQDVLKILGVHPYEAYKLMRIFRKKDEDSMPELYRIHRDEEEKYISMYQKHNADLEELMKMDLDADMEELDKAWSVGKPEG